MSDEKPPADDGFAQLFSRLPDPRSRAPHDGGDRDASPSASSAHVDATAMPRSDSPVAGRNDTGAPLSRRQMRELAAGAAAPPESSDVPPQPPLVSGAAPALPATASAATSPHPALTKPRAPEPSPSGPAPTAPVMTLDELFADEKQARPTKTEKRRNRRIGGWIALIVVLVLLGGLAAAGAWVWNTYEDSIRALMGWEEPRDFEAGLANGEALVTISSGDGGQAISETLHEAGVTKTPDAFYSWLIGLDSVPTFYPGVYRLQLQMTAAAALEALQDPASKLENSAQVREGLTVDQTLPLLAEGVGLPIEELVAAVADPAAYGVPAQSLEGWLFPATYTFDPGTTAPQVIQNMVDRTIQSLDAAAVPVEERQRILTIASIIQREARFAEDFYRVSRVIVNRLDPGNQETSGLLQMDSTAQYGYGELHDGTVSTSGAALEHDNPWNTYVYAGLPIGPIANPGDTAIDAAMNPAEGPWLYFVTVNLDTGETIFTETHAEHQDAVARWQQWCRDNPDSGC